MGTCARYSNKRNPQRKRKISRETRQTTRSSARAECTRQKKKKFYLKKVTSVQGSAKETATKTIIQYGIETHQGICMSQVHCAKKNTKLLYTGKKERKCTRIIRSKFCNKKKAKLV